MKAEAKQQWRDSDGGGLVETVHTTDEAVTILRQRSGKTTTVKRDAFEKRFRFLRSLDVVPDAEVVS